MIDSSPAFSQMTSKKSKEKEKGEVRKRDWEIKAKKSKGWLEGK